MDLLIAILMMMGVSATPDNLKDQDFLDKNSGQIKAAQEKYNSMTPEDRKAAGDEKSIVVLGGGNG